MKIITLIPTKNEAWILKFSLKNITIFSDEVILLDDGSTDDTVAIASSFKNITVIRSPQDTGKVNMSERRSLLLKEGRKAEGTHFVFLDADETFSSTFLNNLQNYIILMKSGDTLCLPWLLIFKEGDKIFYNKKKEFNKDFIFCDDKISDFRDLTLSEERTPITGGSKINVPLSDGYVLHFQQLAHLRNQYKQIWYRLNEHIEGKRSPKKINATYQFTKTLSLKNKVEIKDDFSKENIYLIDPHKGEQEPLERIKKLFEHYSVTYFEPLDIWFRPELHKIFKDKERREPKIQEFPQWLLYVNNKKNKLKNTYLKVRGK